MVKQKHIKLYSHVEKVKEMTGLTQCKNVHFCEQMMD